MRSIVLVVVLLSALNLVLGHNGTVLGPRIVGGENAAAGFFPYQASIKDPNGNHICNGVIIKSSVILTTAHCVYNKNPLSLTVLVGTIQLSQGGSSYPIKAIKIHERFSPRTLSNDIALIKLLSNIPLTSETLPISWDTSFVGDEVVCVLSGWGFRQQSGGLSDYLQYLFSNTIKNDECRQKLNRPIEQSQICTLTKAGEGTCYKDAGSPLVADGRLVGIVSWGRPCAIGFPDVHTRISSYNDWLLANY